ncbi:MAG: XRE family transcriptional regulator [Victivallaceae bacterium]|nr:XRE family transcriptional regulator [Victivallaceae bacterium]
MGEALLAGLGAQLKRIRKERKMTLQEVAGKTGLSAGLISRIENFRTVPSLPVLFAVSGALGADLSVLFAASDKDRSPGRRYRLVRAGQGEAVEREQSCGIDYRMLLEAPLRADRIQAMLVEIRPGARRKKITGEGVELLYLLRGECGYRIGEELLSLSEGDTLCFDSRIPHAPEGGEKAATMLAVYAIRETEDSLF